jgi:hypothetical protein
MYLPYKHMDTMMSIMEFQFISFYNSVIRNEIKRVGKFVG